MDLCTVRECLILLDKVTSTCKTRMARSRSQGSVFYSVSPRRVLFRGFPCPSICSIDSPFLAFPCTINKSARRVKNFCLQMVLFAAWGELHCAKDKRTVVGLKSRCIWNEKESWREPCQFNKSFSTAAFRLSRDACYHILLLEECSEWERAVLVKPSQPKKQGNTMIFISTRKKTMVKS